MRALSLLLACAVAVTLLGYPHILGTRIGPAAHSILPFLLLGVCGAFVHGLGFRPDTRALRLLFGAPVAWSLIGGSIALLAMLRS